MIAKEIALSAEHARGVLNYDHISGTITWKVDCRGGIRAGAEAGCLAVRGRVTYRAIRLNGHLYLAHRLAWFLYYGVWPSSQIDHIDGDGLNNSIENLRDVSHRENKLNHPIPASNTSGAVGVYWWKRDKCWRASIGVNGKQVNLGLFNTFEEAYSARKDAEAKYGFHKNNGRAA